MSLKSLLDGAVRNGAPKGMRICPRTERITVVSDKSSGSTTYIAPTDGVCVIESSPSPGTECWVTGFRWNRLTSSINSLGTRFHFHGYIPVAAGEEVIAEGYDYTVYFYKFLGSEDLSQAG